MLRSKGITNKCLQVGNTSSLNRKIIIITPFPQNRLENCYRFCALGSRTETHDDDGGLYRGSAGNITTSDVCVTDSEWLSTSDPAAKSFTTTT